MNRCPNRSLGRYVRVTGCLAAVALATALALVVPGGMSAEGISAVPLSAIDLSRYVRVGRFDLPEPTRTAAPAGSVLAQEVSAVTYNWDTDTLFVVGDGGTSIVQVTKTGALINSMTLAPGSSPQGTDFYDPEGLAYAGGGRFVMAEERDRQAVLFTYTPGTTLSRSGAQTVKLGTFAPNIGIEGISYDPATGGFIAVKESAPQGIFQTGIDFVAGTATNGSPSTENSVDLSSADGSSRFRRRVRAVEPVDVDGTRVRSSARAEPGVGKDPSRRSLGSHL